jgi:hypothetical protein
MVLRETLAIVMDLPPGEWLGWRSLVPLDQQGEVFDHRNPPRSLGYVG